jgi:hypothetical protein
MHSETKAFSHTVTSLTNDGFDVHREQVSAAAASAASALARDFSHAKGLCASTEAASALHEALWALQCLAWHSTVP